jgi:hypothetical protein
VRRGVCVCAGEKGGTPFKQGGGSRTPVTAIAAIPLLQLLN